MHNIDGIYTLTEIAKELNVVPTFINRIQRETGIGGHIGTKGKVASFNVEDVKIFRIVKALRIIGLGFEDIKRLWILERNLIHMQARIRHQDPSIFPAHNGDPNFPSIKLVLHIGTVYYKKTIDVLNSKEAVRSYESYSETIERLISYKREIEKKRSVFRDDLKKIDAELDAVIIDAGV